MADDRWLENEDVVDFGVRTGRFSAERAPYWRARLADERRVMASSGKAPALPVAELIRSMAPVLADDTQPGRVEGSPWARDEDGHWVLASAYGSPRRSETPLLDQITEAVYGPGVEERRRREDLAAERELAEFDQAEASRVAASALTAAEMRALFGEADE